MLTLKRKNGAIYLGADDIIRLALFLKSKYHLRIHHLCSKAVPKSI